jgi:hypothetical protein
MDNRPAMRRRPDPAGRGLEAAFLPAGSGAALAGLTLLGALLRVPGLFTELWLDEIWSIQVARQARSVADFFVTYRTENNHLLNSLWLYLVSGATDAIVFRLPSFAAGVVTVPLAALAGFRWSRRAGLLAGALVALSSPLVALSTEARGYALALAFALALALVLARHLDAPSPRTAAAFGAFAALGLLSHLLFVHALAGAFAWSAWRIGASPAPARERLGALARLWAFPAAFAALLWWVFARHLVEGQGPRFEPLVTAAEAAALALGLPDRAPWSALALLAAAATIAVGVFRARREGDDSWVFLLGVSVVSPALVVAATHYAFLRPRHLILSMLFFLLLLARLASPLLEKGGRAGAVTLAGLLLLAGGNLWRTAGFVREGRGHYLEALREIVRKSPGSGITIGGDHDFRQLMTIDFYRDRLPPGVDVAYVTQDRWPPGGPDWAIVQNPDAGAVPTDSITPAGIRYVLDRAWRFSGSSGLCWFVYRKADRAAPTVP